MSNKDDVKKLIAQHYRRLQKLKEKEALQGLSVDPSIPLEIEDIEAKITELHKQLAESMDLTLPENHLSARIESMVKIILLERKPSLRDFRRWLHGE